MTDEELKKIRRGDNVKLTLDVLRTPEEREGEFYLQLRNITFYVPKSAMKALGEYVPRRKFKLGDLVRWKNIDYLVLDDEYDSGQVLLQYSINGGTFATANEVKLLMPAYEVDELRPRGGEL